MYRVIRDMLIVCMFFLNNMATAAEIKDCQYLISQTESWLGNDKLATIQITFNEQDGEKGRFSLVHGYLNIYNPDEEVELEGVLQGNQAGIFLRASGFATKAFNFGDQRFSNAALSSIKLNQKKNVNFVMLTSGESYVFLGNSESFDLFLVNSLQCYSGGFFDSGFYMTGFFNYKMSTVLVSFVIRNISE